MFCIMVMIRPTTNKNNAGTVARKNTGTRLTDFRPRFHSRTQSPLIIGFVAGEFGNERKYFAIVRVQGIINVTASWFTVL